MKILYFVLLIVEDIFFLMDFILEYAPPVSDELWRDYLYLKEKGADLREILYTIKHGKYNAINFDHVKFETVDKIIKGNTVEIRCGNGCKNPIIIQKIHPIYIK